MGKFIVYEYVIMQECNDPCCNATTCTLNDDADCGSGVCCKNCKVSVNDITL